MKLIEVKKMENSTIQDIDNMEKEAKFTIIMMEDEENDETITRYLQSSKQKLANLYDEFRTWLLENQDNEKAVFYLDKLKSDTEKLIQFNKAQIQKWKEDEALQEKIAKGVKTVSDASEKLVDVVGLGVKEVMNNETVLHVISSVDDKFTQFKQDERVQKNVVKLKKSTLRVAESAFHGLQKILETDSNENQSEE